MAGGRKSFSLSRSPLLYSRYMSSAEINIYHSGVFLTKIRFQRLFFYFSYLPSNTINHTSGGLVATTRHTPLHTHIEQHLYQVTSTFLCFRFLITHHDRATC